MLTLVGSCYIAQEMDAEVLAALPEEIQRELRLAQMQQSSRAARTKAAPAREPAKANGPAAKRARKGGGNTHITRYFARGKPA